MPDQTPDQPKRYRCRHIFTDGHRCGSPCLRREEFCYYHHTTRRPIEDPSQRRARTTAFDLPLPEDRSSIQHAIGEVLQRIAANEIDPKRAGLLLYGLQIASLNLPKAIETKLEPVEEIVSHPQYGTLAPQAEVIEEKQRPSLLAQLLEDLKRGPQTQPVEPQPTEEEQINPEPEPLTLLNLQACEEEKSKPCRIRRSHQGRPKSIKACCGSVCSKVTSTVSPTSSPFSPRITLPSTGGWNTRTYTPLSPAFTVRS